MAITTEFQQKSQNPKQFQKLVFVGGREKQTFSCENLKLFSSAHLFLCNVQIDDLVVITKIITDRKTKKILYQLGLKPANKIRIASKTITDSIIIAINDRHIGLGSAITQK